MNPYRDKTIFVGCSGGVDSMVLVHFLHKNSFRLHLLHVNYQKRGADSEADSKFVESYAKKNNIHFDISIFPKQTKGNFQQQARIFRYRFFEDIAQKENGIIVLAHHADDNIETFFMNLSRKSGIIGLAGIPRIKLPYIRPLLHIQKHDLINYAQKNALSWREDESNFSTQYYRNRWRLEFIPMMIKHVPTFKESISILIESFAKTQRYLEDKMCAVASEIIQTKKMPITFFEQYSQEELFELWRQLRQPHSLFLRFLELKNYSNGKFIETELPFQRIIRERKYLLFIQAKSESKIPKLNIEIVDQLPLVYSKNELYLDPDAVEGNLYIRKWKHEDRIASIGVQGTQSVAKIIKDSKVTHDKRASVYVVCDTVNIHWVIGLKIGRKAIPKGNKTKILKVTIVF